MAFSDSDSSSSCSDPSDDWENDIVETSKPKSSSSSAKKDEAKGGIKLDIGTDKNIDLNSLLAALGAPPSKTSTTTKTTTSSSGFGSSSKSSGFGGASKTSNSSDPFAKLFENTSKTSTTSSSKANPFANIPMAGTKSSASSTKTTTSTPAKTTAKSPPKPAARKKVVCKQLTIDEDWVQKTLKKDHDYSAENSTNYFIEHALDIVENGCKEFAKFVARVQVNEFIEDYGPDYDDMAQEYFEFLTEMSSEMGNKNMDICKVQDPDDLPMYSKDGLLEGFLNFFAHDSDQSANIDCLSHIFANCEMFTDFYVQQKSALGRVISYLKKLSTIRSPKFTLVDKAYIFASVTSILQQVVASVKDFFSTEKGASALKKTMDDHVEELEREFTFCRECKIRELEEETISESMMEQSFKSPNKSKNSGWGSSEKSTKSSGWGQSTPAKSTGWGSKTEAPKTSTPAKSAQSAQAASPSKSVTWGASKSKEPAPPVAGYSGKQGSGQTSNQAPKKDLIGKGSPTGTAVPYAGKNEKGFSSKIKKFANVVDLSNGESKALRPEDVKDGLYYFQWQFSPITSRFKRDVIFSQRHQFFGMQFWMKCELDGQLKISLSKGAAIKWQYKVIQDAQQSVSGEHKGNFYSWKKVLCQNNCALDSQKVYIDRDAELIEVQLVVTHYRPELA